MTRFRISRAVLGIGVLTLCTESALAQGTGGDGVTITFLANEGVLLSGANKKVIIDGLFSRYGPEYATPADSTQAALQRALAPFDAIDVVLVTHRHGDHFHPVPVVQHLIANERGTFVSSSQVIDSLRGRLPADGRLATRLLARTTAPGTRRREVINGVSVEMLGLPHGGARHSAVEHLGYVVELGGRRVLHVGDTDIAETSFAPFRLDTARIDVALLPQWMVTSAEGRRVIERWIRPRQVVAFHVADGEAENAARAVRATLPGAVTFGRSLETHRW